LAVEDLQVAVINGEPVQVPILAHHPWRARPADMPLYKFNFFGIPKCIGSNSVSLEFPNV
jgi:hypothetical protein